MTRFRTLVVDDEPLARARLGRLLVAAGCEVLAELPDVGALLAHLREAPRPDLLFLDIEMPGATGLEALAELDPPLPVIFVTAYPQYGARAYEVDAVDYIVKPVYPDRLGRALDKAQRHLASGGGASHARAAVPPPAIPARFPARSGEGHFLLEFKRVSHFEFADLAVWAWLGGKRFRAPWASLGEVEDAFPDQGLLRIQRHLLVRPEAILGLRPIPGRRALVRLADGLELEVSRSMTPHLKGLLGIPRGS